MLNVPVEQFNPKGNTSIFTVQDQNAKREVSLGSKNTAQTLKWNKKRFSVEIKACSQTLYALKETRRKLTQCTASFQSMKC